MKFLVVLFILFSMNIFAQEKDITIIYNGKIMGDVTNPSTPLHVYGGERFIEWVSEWNISETINEGTKNCLHDWCQENIRVSSMISCAVLHDSRGCPNNWGREEWICRKCLRDVIVVEDRKIISPKQKPKTEFEILKEKIDAEKKLEKKNEKK